MPIRIGHWLQGVFNLNGIRRLLKKIPPATKIAIHVGIIAVEALKKVINNPLVDVFTEMTKSGIDDAVVAKAREWLPKVLLEMKLADKCMGLTVKEDIIKCAAEVIGQLAGDYQSQKFDDLGEAFTVAASDGVLTWQEIAGLVKIVFDHEYKPSLKAAA